MTQSLFLEAQQAIPGGVNSPVRAFNGVGGEPVFIDHAQGPYLYDPIGKAYIDYVQSWGPMILGHAHPEVVQAVQQACTKGLSYGAPTRIETRLAEKIIQLVPSIEKVRLVSSGTEATMTAIRLARGFTNRDKIIKFEGCYHGHVDSLLVKAGSGALTLGVPTSPGIPNSVAKHTITLEYNNPAQVRETFSNIGYSVAAIIVEPVAGNMNCIPPQPGFLEALREMCTQYQSLLIFDEVMTGFRVALNGAQDHFGVTPDLTTLGKVIGGGMPVGALGGRREIMEYLAPTGPVYQAGTLSGNPITMTAGLATLNLISQPGFYEALTASTRNLLTGLQEKARAVGIPLITQQAGSMFGLFFTEDSSVETYAQVMQCDVERFKRFFHSMLEQGVYLAPSAFEAGFMSAAHTAADIEKTVEAAGKAFKALI